MLFSYQKVGEKFFLETCERSWVLSFFRELAQQRESSIHEGRMLPDHVHMLISIPPKYSVSHVIGYIKCKSAIYIARTYCGKKRTL